MLCAACALCLDSLAYLHRRGWKCRKVCGRRKARSHSFQTCYLAEKRMLHAREDAYMMRMHKCVLCMAKAQAMHAPKPCMPVLLAGSWETLLRGFRMLRL